MDVLALFEAHRDAVYRLAVSMTGRPADAEDVAQTVFLKLLDRAPVLEPGRERAWLLQVTANECRSLWRGWKRRHTLPLDQAQNVAAPERAPVLAELEQLRPQDRGMLYLFYYEGFSTQEIARMLRISQSAVTSRLSRARTRLKAVLEEEMP